MFAIPSLSHFPPTRVYAGHNFFPLGDQFLLVPRQFAPSLFATVALCYSCHVLRSHSRSGVPAQAEHLLHFALRQAGIPLGYYEFPIVIVRHNEGGVCNVLHPHKISCELLQSSGLIGTMQDRDRERQLHCATIMYDWHRRVCREMFPPRRDGVVSLLNKSSAGISNAWGGATPVVSGSKSSGMVGGGKGGGSEEGSVIKEAEAKVSTLGEAMQHNTDPQAGDSSRISSGETFQQVTGRLSGLQNSLRQLSRGIRVHARPRQDHGEYFVAHHYPFHQANGGPRDEIAIIGGFRLSEADFNRVATATACLLDRAGWRGEASRTTVDDKFISTESTDMIGAKNELSGLVAGSSPFADDELQATKVLTLGTTLAGRASIATVDCSMVESIHDVWMSLLDKEFEPTETTCRGYVGPCLERVAGLSPGTLASTTSRFLAPPFPS